MKHVIFLLFVPYISAMVSLDYNGFQSCGQGGWFCYDSGGPVLNEHEDHSATAVVLDCKLTGRSARIWLWTARLPSKVKKFTVQNCDKLELHVDCTVGNRIAKLEEFRAINITRLILLKTSNRYEYLHDNSPVPHFPPKFYLENVTTKFYGEMFTGVRMECEYNSLPMQEMIIKDSTILAVPSQTFLNTSVDRLHWSNVQILKMEKSSMAVNGNVDIRNCHFGNSVLSEAININGDSVSFVGNTFNELNSDSITVRSHLFNFSKNSIEKILGNALAVQSNRIIIHGNIISNVMMNALSQLTPYIIPEHKLFSAYYEFTDNEFSHISPFSLHCDWRTYNMSCSKMNISGNKFDCTCENLFWLNRGTAGDDNTGFYDLFLQSTHHCNTSVNCTLSSVLKIVCLKDVDIKKQCAGLTEKEADIHNVTKFNFTRYEKDWNYEDVEFTVSYESVQVEGEDLDKAFYKGNEIDTTYVPLSYVLSVVFVIIFLAFMIALVVWYLKKKKNYGAAEIYKYDNKKDSVSLITNPVSDSQNYECDNPLYQEVGINNN